MTPFSSVLKAYFLTLGDSAYPDSYDSRQRGVTKFQELCRSKSVSTPLLDALANSCISLQSSSLSESSRPSPTILSQVNENVSEPKSSFQSKPSPNVPLFEISTVQVDSTRSNSDSPTITSNSPFSDRKSERSLHRRISLDYGVELLRTLLEGENRLHLRPRRVIRTNRTRKINQKIG